MLFWMYMALTFDDMMVTVKVNWIFVQNIHIRHNIELPR